MNQGTTGGTELRDRPLALFRRLTRAGAVPARSPEQCDHLAALPAVAPGDWKDCQDHTPADGLVVFLRACLTCDYVGCCDSSRARHATAHAGATGHPVIQSAQPGESWRWCYEHSLLG
ncbi:MAG TPA: UBP-type zinc finger domain-containing protein [Actinomycetes bacterium]|nr:UBP-type zinc finger domain-containing protein [Actinomycetes bacterium]HJY25400.1 UBP-type zinc finger domain-containing protein [Actinomycetes bacterium]